jgi:hypothetical protein
VLSFSVEKFCAELLCVIIVSRVIVWSFYAVIFVHSFCVQIDWEGIDFEQHILKIAVHSFEQDGINQNPTLTHVCFPSDLQTAPLLLPLIKSLWVNSLVFILI